MPFRGLRVVYLFSADSYRGSAVSFQHLASGLTELGGVPRLLTGHASVTEPLRAEGLDVVQLDLSATSLRTALRLRRELRTFGAEVLVVDRPRDLRLGMLATIGTKIALVSRYNSHAPKPPCDVLTRLAYRFVVRELIFLTHGMAHRVLTAAPWMRRPGHCVIPEGICLSTFRPDAEAAAAFRARHALGDAPFVLAVGALTREKRTAMIVDAMRRMPTPPTLVLCGEGPLREALRAQAEVLGVPVRLVGRVRRAELRGAYSAASVVVHACAVETFGLSVLEAMACGAPVVGVRSGGVVDVVGASGDAGILVNADDVDAMATAVGRVLDDAVLAGRLRVGARARAAGHFPLERMTARYSRAVLGAWSREEVGF
ncbi:MAG: glycosyltransferase family 4 protein [Gemmatimonadota bacterium]|nr:glycosyltransferase family 4 protein [Gemmatimonadota bacterium]